MIAAIVLAAGKSERMGTPKALLRFRGMSFLEHILVAIGKSKIDAVRIVVGRHKAEIEEELSSLTPLVFNPNYESGMVTSIQAGIRALPQDVSAAVLFLVDHPLIQPETIDRLIENFRPGSIIVPVYEGRRGHPVLFSKEVLDEILQLGPEQGANTVLRRDPERVIATPVEDPGVLRDIDTPEDFEELVRETSLS